LAQVHTNEDYFRDRAQRDAYQSDRTRNAALLHGPAAELLISGPPSGADGEHNHTIASAMVPFATASTDQATQPLRTAYSQVQQAPAYNGMQYGGVQSQQQLEPQQATMQQQTYQQMGGQPMSYSNGSSGAAFSQQAQAQMQMMPQQMGQQQLPAGQQMGQAQSQLMGQMLPAASQAPPMGQQMGGQGQAFPPPPTSQQMAQFSHSAQVREPQPEQMGLSQTHGLTAAPVASHPMSYELPYSGAIADEDGDSMAKKQRTDGMDGMAQVASSFLAAPAPSQMPTQDSLGSFSSSGAPQY